MEELRRPPYPGYRVLDKRLSPSWNDRTREVVAKRLDGVPERRFFGIAEWLVLEAVFARLIPQPDRAEPIPILPWLDDKLARDQRDGYRIAAFPPQRETWRIAAAAIDEEAWRRHDAGFAALGPDSQDAVLAAIQNGEVQAEGWARIPPKRFFLDILLSAAVHIYYAHPAAWDEIGFGGPASPRGYVRMGFEESDPWEAPIED